MGASRNGVKRSCVHVTSGKSPLPLGEVRAVCIRGESALARLRQAVARKDLPAFGCGLGLFLRGALTLRAVSSMSTAFFGVRRASEGAALNVSEVRVDLSAGIVDTRVRRQKKCQFGVRQLAHIVSLPLWYGACPVHLLSGWLWLIEWLAVPRDDAHCVSGTEASTPLFVGFALARFGLSMATSGMPASREKVLGGRNLSPRKDSARLYLANGMSRQGTRELGGWKTSTVVESVYKEARPEEVAPEMRSDINNARIFFGVQAFVVDLGDDSCVDGEEAAGSDKGATVRVWSHRFWSLKGYLTPPVAFPFRDNFLGFQCRRVRRLGLSDTRKRFLLSRGADFRDALKVYKNADSEVLVQARDRDEVVDSHKNEKRRLQ